MTKNSIKPEKWLYLLPSISIISMIIVLLTVVVFDLTEPMNYEQLEVFERIFYLYFFVNLIVIFVSIVLAYLIENRNGGNERRHSEGDDEKDNKKDDQ